MIPRANRCIFVNELPDLQARIQVALFNILQEGDIQIRGFKLRMPLDLQFVFTANPEDLQREHSDSIERQNRISNIDTILKRYKLPVPLPSKKLMMRAMVHVPSLAKDLLEQIFEARESEFIDKR
jgi:magnesium chelatase subunit I